MKPAIHYDFIKLLFKNRHNRAAYAEHHAEAGYLPAAAQLQKLKEEINHPALSAVLKNYGFFAEETFSLYHVRAGNLLVTLMKQAPAQLNVLLANMRAFEQCLALFAGSIALSWSLIKNAAMIPELFPIATEGIKHYRERIVKELAALISKNQDDSGTAPVMEERRQRFMRVLRLAKLREFIRIAILDYMAEDNIATTTEKLASFADAAINAAFTLAELPQYELGVIAMGKLGGMELNYNSDIDLMFISGEAVAPRYPPLMKALQNFISLIGKLTEEGLVFKVDLQIRPEGTAGELYLSPQGYQQYYEHRGGSWERQALIKGRFVAGPAALRFSFERLREDLVYGGTVTSEQFLVDIFRMKERIEAQLRSRTANMQSVVSNHLQGNFKLGLGGIRDVEFLIQFLQLHHGRFTATLRQGNTLRALQQSFNYKLLSMQETVMLTEHYEFMRKLEHRLQLMQLLPVRELPQLGAEIDYLAGLCGYARAQKRKRFLADYTRSGKRTRELFDKLFKHTTLFLTKLKQLEKIAATSALAQWQTELRKFESDYFLQFSVTKLRQHLKFLSKLSETQPVEGIVRVKGKLVSFELAVYSLVGSFSVVAGHISTKGINILSGFIFPQVDERMTGGMAADNVAPEHFYRRSFTEDWAETATAGAGRGFVAVQPGQGTAAAVSRSKTIVWIRGEFTSSVHLQNFHAETFMQELRAYYKLIFNDQPAKVREAIYLHALPFMEERKEEFEQVKPIAIDIDNDSHLFYTVLRIKSADIFLFLYQFTFSLSEQRFRIAKAQLATRANTIDNVIYITERDRQKVTAATRLREIEVTLVLLNYFTRYLVFAPNPYLAYTQFSRLLHRIVGNASSVTPLLHGGPVLKKLAQILGTSQAIFEDFFRTDALNISQYLSSEKALKTPHTEEYLKKRLELMLAAGRYESILSQTQRVAERYSVAVAERDDVFNILNRFKNDAIFAIDLRFLGGEIKEFQKFSLELSGLADVVLSAALSLLVDEQLAKFELSRAPGQLALFGLGKWGGREMGYSSDVEVLLIYRAETVDGNAELARRFFEELGRKLALAIKSKKNGVFELDFRLRPDGESSPIAVAYSKFKTYYVAGNVDVRNFERMAFTKLRAITQLSGAEALVADVFAVRNAFVFGARPFDTVEFTRLRRLQVQQFTNPKTVNVKFSLGGLVDIEYYVQRLLILYGHHYEELRVTHTLTALHRLVQLQLLSPQVEQVLSAAYNFYRIVINSLRILRGNAQDLELPAEGSLEFYYFIRRVIFFKGIVAERFFMEKLLVTLAEVKKVTDTVSIDAAAGNSLQTS